MPVNKPSEIYKQNVRSLYKKFFRSFVNDEIISNEEKEDICFIIATILSNKYSFPNKTDKNRRFIAQYEKVNHKFSKSTYEKFFKINNISNIFEMFFKSGINESLFLK